MARLLLVLGLVLAVAAPAVAGDAGSLLPKIPMGTADAHPEGNDYWRRHHMELMRHDRDRTMYDGARPVEASLSACFDCHTVRDEARQPVTYQDERHFCRVCHDYAAVKVDCFMCHRSTPPSFDEPMPHALNASDKD